MTQQIQCLFNIPFSYWNIWGKKKNQFSDEEKEKVEEVGSLLKGWEQIKRWTVRESGGMALFSILVKFTSSGIFQNVLSLWT